MDGDYSSFGSFLSVYHRRQTIEPRDEDTSIAVTDERRKDGKIEAKQDQGFIPFARRKDIHISLSRWLMVRSIRGAIQSVPYNTHPGIGSSIGLSGVNGSSGTMGGFVQLKREGEATKTCAMTCHHVLQATKISPSVSKTVEQQSEGPVLLLLLLI